jgi:hypothetical protein
MWYKLQQPQFAYSASFSKTKIMYPHFSLRPNFSMVKSKFWGNDKTYTIPLEDYYLIALLNSHVVWFFLDGICAIKAGGFRELRVIYIDQVTIPEALPADKKVIASLAEQLSSEVHKNVQELEMELNDRVNHLYKLIPEEISIVNEYITKGYKTS